MTANVYGVTLSTLLGWFNVQAPPYNAAGDGVTDDTAAIQAAINACSAAGGGTVYLPQGTYKITAALTTYNKVLIQGDGDIVTTIHQVTSTANGITGSTLNNVGICGLTLQGPAGGSGMGIAITTACNYIRLEDLTVTGWGSNGIDIEQPIVSNFSRVVCRANLGSGMHLYGNASGAGTSISLDSCWMDGNSGHGYYFYNMTYCAFTACAADNHSGGGTAGYYFSACSGMTLTGCGSELNVMGVRIGGGNAYVVNGFYNNANPASGVGFLVTASATEVFLTGITESAPNASASHWVQVDAGCTATIRGSRHTTADLLASGTTILVSNTAGVETVTGSRATGQNQTIGATAPLGDNGVGVLELANAATVPTTNPTGGAVAYAQGGVIKWRSASGAVYDLSQQTPISATRTITTATVTANAWDVLECNATSNAITVTLPANTAGVRVIVKKVDSSANAVTISGTIDGTVNPTLTYQYQSVELIADGTNWIRATRPSLGALVDYPATTDARYQQKVFINVKTDYGAKGDGVTDDTTAIQNAINGAPAGAHLFFPAGTYIISTALNLVSDLTYEGANVDKTIIKMKNAANLAAVAATTGWVGSTATSSVDPVHLRNLTFDGNKTNQTSGAGHGVVLQTYYATVQNCVFQNTRGDGLRLDAYGANGTTAISNTMVENWISRIQCRNNGGSGFVVNDPSHNKATDGWLQHAIVDTPGVNGIWIGAGAGWEVAGCHVYNIPQSGIRVDRAFESRIVNNYVESCGSSTTSGTYFLIDCANFAANDNGQGSTIAGNTIYFQGPPGNVGSTIAGIAFQSASGGSANVSITGNQIFCTGSSGLAAIQLQNQNSTASLTAAVSGNNFVGWGTNVQTIANGGSMKVTGSNSPTALSTLPDASIWLPSDHGFLAWTMDPGTTSANGTTLSAGYIYMVEVVLRQPATISKIDIVVGVAGSGLTANQCLAGLYTSSGTRVGITADMSTTWNSAGDKQMALTASYSAQPGKYYIALLFNGTTSPTIACGSTFGAAFTPGNAGLSAGSYRWCRSASGQTALPTSAVLSGYTPDANNIYAAVL